MLYNIFQVLHPPKNEMSVKDISVPIALTRYIDKTKYITPLVKKDNAFAFTPLNRSKARNTIPIPKEINIIVGITSNHPNHEKLLITINKNK
jgi:hypothetical protein